MKNRTPFWFTMLLVGFILIVPSVFIGPTADIGKLNENHSPAIPIPSISGQKNVSTEIIQKQRTSQEMVVGSNFSIEHNGWIPERYDMKISNVSDTDFKEWVIQSNTTDEDSFIIQGHVISSNGSYRPQSVGSNFTLLYRSVIKSFTFHIKVPIDNFYTAEYRYFIHNITVDIRVDDGGTPSTTANITSNPLDDYIIIHHDDGTGFENSTYINKTVGYVIDTYADADPYCLQNVVIKSPELNLTLPQGDYWFVVNGRKNHNFNVAGNIWMFVKCYNDGVDDSLLANRTDTSDHFEIDDTTFVANSSYDMQLSIVMKTLDYDPAAINMTINNQSVPSSGIMSLFPSDFNVTDTETNFTTSADRDIVYHLAINGTYNSTQWWIVYSYNIDGDDVTWSGNFPITDASPHCVSKTANVTFPVSWNASSFTPTESVQYHVEGHTVVFNDTNGITEVHFTIHSPNMISYIVLKSDAVNASAIVFFTIYGNGTDLDITVELWNNGSYVYLARSIAECNREQSFELRDDLVNGTGYYLVVKYNNETDVGYGVSPEFEIVDFTKAASPSESSSESESSSSGSGDTNTNPPPTSDSSSDENTDTSSDTYGATITRLPPSLIAAITAWFVVTIFGGMAYIRMNRRYAEEFYAQYDGER